MSSSGRTHRTARLGVILAVLFPLTYATSSAKPDPAVKKLVKKLRSASPEKRAGAAYELGRMGSAAASAASDLTRLLADETPVFMLFDELQPVMPYEEGHAEPKFYYDELMERSALGALMLGVSSELGAKSKQLTTLGDLAARALGNMDPGAHAYLLDALHDSNPRARIRIALALGETKDPSVGEALTPLLQDSDPFARRAAALSLGLLGDPETAEHLIQALRDPDDDVRGAAFESLQQLRASIPQDAVSALLRDENRRIRLQVAVATGADSIIAAEALTLLRLIGDEDWKVREPASKELVELNNTCSVAQMVIDFLRDGNPNRYAIERASFVLRELSELKPRSISRWQAWWDANKGASKKRPCSVSAGLP